MADRPILFAAPMVRALLEGRKTQTRRIFKAIEQQPNGLWHIFGGMVGVSEEDVPMHAPDYVRIQPGDRLYVREHWRTDFSLDDVAPRDLDPTKHEYPNKKGYCRDGTFFVTYEADNPALLNGRHRQAMHMPRWLSRLTLIVDGVKVERLQDISEADAIAEGIFRLERKARIGGGPLYGLGEGEGHDTAIGAYNRLWRDINGDGSWAGNPWVVAYTFRVMKGNIDQIGGAS
jgi:hypothetical protein